MGLKDKTRDELEHTAIISMIKTMASDISVNFSDVEYNFKAMLIKNDSERETLGQQLENILAEQKKTNGKVKALEQDTKILSFFMNHKVILALSMIGLYAIYNLDLNELFKIIRTIL